METRAHTPTGRGRIWIVAMAIPILWMLQEVAGFWITAKACPPEMEPLHFTSARIAIGVLSLVAVILGAIAILAALKVWRSLTTPSHEGRTVTAVDERVRFVATLGLIVGITLTLGLLLAGLAPLILRACGETR